jgi:hypothetical protein
LSEETIALGQALADAATTGIVHQRADARQEIFVEQLQAALNSRVVIGQSKRSVVGRLAISVRSFIFDTYRDRTPSELFIAVMAWGFGDRGPPQVRKSPARRESNWQSKR